jgi:hypothetical protein
MFDAVASSRDGLAAAACSLDIESLVGSQAVALVALLGDIRRLNDGLLMRASLRVKDTNAHHDSADRSAADLCARLIGIEPAEARRAIDTASKVAAHPDVEGALRTGELTANQAAKVVAAAEVNPSAISRLLSATRQGSDALRDACNAARSEIESEHQRTQRHRRGRTFHMWTGNEGMVEGRFALAPETGGPLKALIEHEAQRRFRSHAGDEPIGAMAADALVDLILGHAAFGTVESSSTMAGEAQSHADASADTGAGDDDDTMITLFDDDDIGYHGPSTSFRTDGSTRVGDHGPSAAPAAQTSRRSSSAKALGGVVRATVHVVIDHSALVRGHALGGEQCEIPGVGPVNVPWVRSLIGDAFITAVVKKGKDITTVAHFGRHIPAELRTALIVGGRECVVEGCRCRGYLEIDHQDLDFAQGGPAAMWNLGWMCIQHHRMKSRGWTLDPPDPITGKRRLCPPLARTG